MKLKTKKVTVLPAPKTDDRMKRLTEQAQHAKEQAARPEEEEDTITETEILLDDISTSERTKDSRIVDLVFNEKAESSTPTKNLFDILEELGDIADYGLVLQKTAAGWYIQVQTVKQAKVKSATKTVDLVWEPITGIYSRPIDAILAAQTVPFGRNRVDPPGELEKPTETFQETLDRIQKQAGVKVSEPETETAVQQYPLINFIAYSDKENIPPFKSVSVYNRSGSKIFCREGADNRLGLIFDIETGRDTSGNYYMAKSVQAKVDQATQSMADDNAEGSFDKGVVYLSLEPEKIEDESETERDLRLKALIGREVTGRMLYPPKELVRGIFMGIALETKAGQQYAIKKRHGKPVAVGMDSIREVV